MAADALLALAFDVLLRSRQPGAAELLLVELAVGRAWGEAKARELLAGALDRLRAAVDPDARPAEELAALARLAVHRDR